MSKKYGNDLIIFDGDLVISARGDLAGTKDYEKTQVVPFEGYYNVIFSTLNRIGTIVGELPIHPEYGTQIPLLVSTPGKPEIVDKITQELSESLLQDPRISEVITTDVSIDNNKVSARAEVILIGKTESSVFIFPNFYIE
jgi:phage baseplate assembly protein W